MSLSSALVYRTAIVKVRTGAAAFGVALLIGAGCAPSAVTIPATPSPVAVATSQPTDSGPTSANPVTLKTVVPSSILYASFYVGIEKGIYLKHGIDLKLTIADSGANAMKAFQGGEAQFSANSWVGVAPVATLGVPIRVFSLVTGRPDVVNYDAINGVVLRPGLSGVADVAGLKGLKIASAFGGGADLYVRTLLKRAGLDPEKDTTLINVTQPNQLAAIQTQRVDAAVSSEPYSSLVLTQVPGSRLLVRNGGVSDVRIVLIAMAPWLTQNPVLADRVVAAHTEASQYVRQHPDEAAVATSHYLSGIDVAVLAASLKVISFDPRWSDKVLQGFDGSTQSLLENGSLKVAPKTTDFLALELISNAEKKYPQYFSDLK